MKRLWLETERLLLTYPHIDDLPHQIKLQSDPEVMKFISQKARTAEEVQKWLDKQITLNDKHGFATGLLSLRDGTVIGRAGMIYLDYDDSQEKIEFGYALFPEYWGHGYATEISKALIDFAFDKLKIETLYATANQSNKQSAHVLKKCGLVSAGQAISSSGVIADLYKIHRS